MACVFICMTTYREIDDIREQWANNRRTKERYSKLLYTIAKRISPYVLLKKKDVPF